MQLNGPLPLWQEDNPTESIAAIIESNVLDQGLARTLPYRTPEVTVYRVCIVLI